MHFHQNHCFCQASHWDNDWYNASYMVDIDQYVAYDVTIPHHEQLINPDWTEMVDHVKVLDQGRYETNSEIFEEIAPGKTSDQKLREMSMTSCPTPTPAVMQWLNDNVQPEAAKRLNTHGHGWAMGNEDYRSRGQSGRLVFWFYRRSDAMKFIKEWSVYTKPTTYLNYFKDDLRKLIDGKLTKVDQL
jgi:hypothetical protein